MGALQYFTASKELLTLNRTIPPLAGIRSINVMIQHTFSTTIKSCWIELSSFYFQNLTLFLDLRAGFWIPAKTTGEHNQDVQSIQQDNLSRENLNDPMAIFSQHSFSYEHVKNINCMLRENYVQRTYQIASCSTYLMLVDHFSYPASVKTDLLSVKIHHNGW